MTILRGFKVPLAVLDRFLEANRVEQTGGYTPSYSVPPRTTSIADAGSLFLPAKLAASRFFIPQFDGESTSTYAYVAYAWIMIYAPAEHLPNRAPPDFAELRSEVLGVFKAADEIDMLQVRRLDGEGEDPAAALFVGVADDQPYSLARFLSKSDLRCDHCDETFDDWGQRRAHQQDTHGCVNVDLS